MFLRQKTTYKAQPKNMSIVMFLGRNVKEYCKISEDTIKKFLIDEALRCEFCAQPMARHSTYQRSIKETGEKISIIVVWCSKCQNWHALTPDFLLPRKHYSGNEIESVIIDSELIPVKLIETEASEATVWRWIDQIGDKIIRAVSILKYYYRKAGQAISEVAVDASHTYSELEQLLELAPTAVKYSGNKLGLANLWLGISGRAVYI